MNGNEALVEVFKKLGDTGVTELNRLLSEAKPKSDLERAVLSAIADGVQRHGLTAVKQIAEEIGSVLRTEDMGSLDPTMFASLSPVAASDLLAAVQREAAVKRAEADAVLDTVGNILALVVGALLKALAAAA